MCMQVRKEAEIPAAPDTPNSSSPNTSNFDSPTPSHLSDDANPTGVGIDAESLDGNSPTDTHSGDDASDDDDHAATEREPTGGLALSTHEMTRIANDRRPRSDGSASCGTDAESAEAT
eukprot:CAMPEP_0197425466 /NCGR_PEP_ID=MMETSP1170-20131217/30828_1 /TAXON_ID=54406 /ORGANISM="Sarcinochrysis sp, Strain CCMP770" /LENGTH=117 /DNA_ID=CAMNT_0042953021 /DNA_START=198 /DNA_END=551 /DNA_ORIENTATION=-